MLALFLRAADPLLGAALLLDAAALSLLGVVTPSLGAVVLPPWRDGALPWRGGLIVGGAVALLLRAADPLLGAALLLDAEALSILGAVALSLGAVVLPPWRDGALPCLGGLLSTAPWPSSWTGRRTHRRPRPCPSRRRRTVSRVHLLDRATAVAEAVSAPLAAARRAMPPSSWTGRRRQRIRKLM